VFAGDKRHARQVRLVVRRVRPTPGSQLALFTTWDYHAFVTDRTLPLPEVEADHRRHAVVEQSIAELKSAGLKHLPSGRFTANAAWLALAVMAHNLGRAVGQLAGPDLDTATAATLRRCDAAAQGLHHARPARAHRPTPTPTTTGALALGRPGPPGPDPHHRDPAALLNATPTTRNPEKPADRHLTPARGLTSAAGATTDLLQLPTRQDQRWLIRGGAGLLRFTRSRSLTRPTKRRHPATTGRRSPRRNRSPSHLLGLVWDSSPGPRSPVTIKGRWDRRCLANGRR